MKGFTFENKQKQVAHLAIVVFSLTNLANAKAAFLRRLLPRKTSSFIVLLLYSASQRVTQAFSGIEVSPRSTEVKIQSFLRASTNASTAGPDRVLP